MSDDPQFEEIDETADWGRLDGWERHWGQVSYADTSSGIAYGETFVWAIASTSKAADSHSHSIRMLWGIHLFTPPSQVLSITDP